MATPFSRTLHALETDSGRWSAVALALGAILLVAWCAWFFLAEVSVYVASSEGRLETRAAPHPVAAGVEGRVVAVHASLDQPVAAGEVLVELDATGELYQLEEERARQQALKLEVAAQEQELASERRAAREALEASQAAVEEARARREEARKEAELASADAGRAGRLRTEGLMAEAEEQRAAARADQSRSEARASDAALSRLVWAHRTAESEGRARLGRLEQELARLRGQLEASGARISGLEHEVDRRWIRAPVGGRIGEIAELRPGSVLAEGEWICTVVPPGDVKVVADFPVAEALGRIRPGQRAVVRLTAFPWTEFGSLPAAVSRVGSEAGRGGIRVELEPDLDEPSAIPSGHGLTGSVEVEVERATPAALVLRAAGRLVSQGGRSGTSR